MAQGRPVDAKCPTFTHSVEPTRIRGASGWWTWPKSAYLGFVRSMASSSARLPLRGFFALEWWDGPGVDVAPLPAREVLSLLFSQEYIVMMGPTDPLTVLELGTLPAWRVRRPRTNEGAQEAVASMLATAAST